MTFAADSWRATDGLVYFDGKLSILGRKILWKILPRFPLGFQEKENAFNVKVHKNGNFFLEFMFINIHFGNLSVD